MLISLIIPCFNEAPNASRISERLPAVVARLRETNAVEVIFVDDGSTDGTAALLEKNLPPDFCATIIRHDRNRGLGAALRTGFAAARGEVAITTDSDDTYRFEDIPRILSALVPQVDVVTASPYHPEGAVEGVPPARLLLSRVCSALYRAATGSALHTYTSLFRVYRRPVIDRVRFASDEFVSVAEILVSALQNGFRVAEMPAILHSRAAGASKMKVARTASAHLRLILASMARRGRPPS